MKSAVILIPARRGSTRFPDKPLALIHGEPMIARAARIARQSALAAHIAVLSDSSEVLEASGHPERVHSNALFANGTERCAAAAARLPKSTIVCIYQGDEITLTGRDLDLAIMAAETHDVTTLATQLPTRVIGEDDVFVRLNPTLTCVEFDRGKPKLGHHHAGVYVTSVGRLIEYVRHQTAPWELALRLEQLRWEAMGVGIRAVRLPILTESVNRPSDIPFVENLLCQNASILAGVPVKS